MKSIRYIIPLLALLLSACSRDLDLVGMFNGQSPDTDERFANSMVWNNAHGYDTICLPLDDYRVYVGTDFHLDSAGADKNLRRFLCDMRNDETLRLAGNTRFGLFLGDCVNAQGNFPYFHQAVQYHPAEEKYNDTLYVIAGNHDLYWGQWTNYLTYFHTSTFYFTVLTPNARDLYICLDASNGTLGIQQMAWLKQLLAEKQNEGFRHIVVCMHTHLFKQDASQGHTSNFALEETYEITHLFATSGVSLCLMGHDHHRELTTYQNVTYRVIDSMADPADDPYYARLTVGEQINTDFISLK